MHKQELLYPIVIIVIIIIVIIVNNNNNYLQHEGYGLHLNGGGVTISHGNYIF